MPATLKQVYSAAKFVNSVNNGPWGQALTAELIPYLERQYRMDAKPLGRQRQPAECDTRLLSPSQPAKSNLDTLISAGIAPSGVPDDHSL